MVNEDWLGTPEELEVQSQAQEEQRLKAIEFAKNYEIFRTDSRGIALLKHWDAVYRRRKTPVDSSVQVYAADAAVREFIEGIHQQLELAQER